MNEVWVDVFGFEEAYEVSNLGNVRRKKRPEKLIVHHKDGNKYNNNLDNLELTTRKCNFNIAMEKGLINFAHGERSWNTKLKNSIVLDIRKRFENGERQIDIARHYNITKATVYHIVRNKTWRHLL